MENPVENKSFTPHLQNERGQTDESLNAERGKTDDSLVNFRKNAERKTDATLKHDRRHADEARARHQQDGEGENDERDAVDNENVADERSKADAALLIERTLRERVLVEFLYRERANTDESLLIERDHTDVYVRQSNQRLTDEVGLHSKTRAELTTRDELLAIVSHDLRNPIGSILSCADMLLSDPEFASVGDGMKYWLELIKRNASTSLRLIADILDMERIAEGKFQIKSKAENLSAVVRESIEPFAQTALANRILLRVIPSTVEITTNFDRDRVAQVLSNLIGNALKFTPEGGTVAISLRKEGQMTVVTVADTGAGIPDAEKKRVFTRYAQLGNKDRRGLGLGLYISKLLIEAHGGELWVTDAPERGSLFHFSLPD
jgi:signal transduction histidine kinase